jgi:tetratricopeptide (TPR) repeat protein
VKKTAYIGLAWGAMAAAAMTAPPAGAQDDAELAVEDSVRKYRFLGKTARDKKDHEAVIQYYTELIKYRSVYHPAHYYMGRAHLALGRSGPAKQALLAAAALDSSHANTNLSLFQIYTATGVPDSAWIHLAPVLRAKPGERKYLRYRRTIADLYRRKGDVASSIGHYTALADNAALSVGDRHELYELLAVMHDDKGNAAAALTWRQRLAGVSGAGQVESLSKMVALQIDTKDYDGAYRTLLQLARMDSAGRYAHFLRMSELGVTANAPAMRLEGLEGMARVNPRDIETVCTISEILMNDDDLAAAGRWIERGLASSPESAHLRVLLGDLLNRGGAEDDAIAEYEKALADPNWSEVAQQRIWQIRPPETEEEKLRRQFFGGDGDTP